MDALANVERGPAAIADEIAGSGYADEAESDAIEFGIGGALVVEGADGGEKLVGGKRKTAHEIDFVDEDHDLLGDGGDDDFADGALPAVKRADAARCHIAAAGVLLELVLKAEGHAETGE